MFHFKTKFFFFDYVPFLDKDELKHGVKNHITGNSNSGNVKFYENIIKKQNWIKTNGSTKN